MREQFLMDLLEVKVFCEENMRKIYVSEQEIVATDGYRCILLRNCSIPESYKNKVIMSEFKTLDNVLVKTITESDQKIYDSVQRVIEFNSPTEESKSMKIYEFVDNFIVKNKKVNGKELAILENKSKYDRVAIDVNYLRSTLEVFEEDEDISINYPRTSISPLLIKSKSKEVLVMPMKVSYSDLE